MLRVNKKVEYGIVALLYLGNDEKIASVREIADSCKIPETLLSKIMQKLKNEGLVAAVHGNQGGYRLARQLDAINLLDVNQVLAGPVRVAECLEPGNGSCPVRESCSIVTPMAVLNQRISELFQSTSLQTLAVRRI